MVHPLYRALTLLLRGPWSASGLRNPPPDIIQKMTSEFIDPRMWKYPPLRPSFSLPPLPRLPDVTENPSAINHSHALRRKDRKDRQLLGERTLTTACSERPDPYAFIGGSHDPTEKAIFAGRRAPTAVPAQRPPVQPVGRRVALPGRWVAPGVERLPAWHLGVQTPPYPALIEQAQSVDPIRAFARAKGRGQSPFAAPPEVPVPERFLALANPPWTEYSAQPVAPVRMRNGRVRASVGARCGAGK